MRERSDDAAGFEAIPVTRRGFLKRAGLGGLAALAVGAAGDVLAAPLAGASGIRPSEMAGRRTVVIDSPDDPSVTCDGVATCTPCNGCCPHGPCPPDYFCFYCTATPCQAAGVSCYHHGPTQFTICCLPSG